MPIQDDLEQFPLSHMRQWDQIVQVSDHAGLLAQVEEWDPPEEYSSKTSNALSGTTFSLLHREGLDRRDDLLYRLGPDRDDSRDHHWCTDIAIYNKQDVLIFVCLFDPLTETVRVATEFELDKEKVPRDIREYQELDRDAGTIVLESRVYDRYETWAGGGLCVDHEVIDEWDPDHHREDVGWEPDLQNPDRRTIVQNRFDRSTGNYEQRTEKVTNFDGSGSNRDINFDDSGRVKTISEIYTDAERVDVGTRVTTYDHEAGSTITTEEFYGKEEIDEGIKRRILTERISTTETVVTEQRTSHFPTERTTPRGRRERGNLATYSNIELTRHHAIETADPTANPDQISVDGMLIVYNERGVIDRSFRLISNWNQVDGRIECTAAIWQNIANPSETILHPVAELNALLLDNTIESFQIDEIEPVESLPVSEAPDFLPPDWEHPPAETTLYEHPFADCIQASAETVEPSVADMLQVDVKDIDPRIVELFKIVPPEGISKSIYQLIEGHDLFIPKGMLPKRPRESGSVTEVRIRKHPNVIAWLCRINPDHSVTVVRDFDQKNEESPARAINMQQWEQHPRSEQMVQTDLQKFRWEDQRIPRPVPRDRTVLTRNEQRTFSYDPEAENIIQPPDHKDADAHAVIERRNYPDRIDEPKVQTERHQLPDCYLTREIKRSAQDEEYDILTCTETLKPKRDTNDILTERTTTTVVAPKTDSTVSEHAVTTHHLEQGNIEVERTVQYDDKGMTIIEEQREYPPTGEPSSSDQAATVMRIETRVEDGAVVSRSGTLTALDHNGLATNLYTMIARESVQGQPNDIWQDHHGNIILFENTPDMTE